MRFLINALRELRMSPGGRQTGRRCPLHAGRGHTCIHWQRPVAAVEHFVRPPSCIFARRAQQSGVIGRLAPPELTFVVDEVVAHVALLAGAVGVELGRLVVASEVVRSADAGRGIGGALAVEGLALSTSFNSASVKCRRASPFGTKRLSEAYGAVEVGLGEESVEPPLRSDHGEVDGSPLRDVDELEVEEKKFEAHHPSEAQASDREVDGLMNEARSDEGVGSSRGMTHHDPQGE